MVYITLQYCARFTHIPINTHPTTDTGSVATVGPTGIHAPLYWNSRVYCRKRSECQYNSYQTVSLLHDITETFPEILLKPVLASIAVTP